MTETEQEPGAGVDAARVAAAVREFLAAIGEDPTREGLQRTPQRVAEAAVELFAGTGVDPVPELRAGVFPVSDAGAGTSSTGAAATPSQPVVLRDLTFRSLCEHHLLPFSGRVHLAYVPGASIVGFGRLHGLLETLSSRLTLQERLGDQLVDAMMEALGARGALAVIEATHGCASLRGSRQAAGTVVTVSARGELTSPIARAEVMALIGGGAEVAAEAGAPSGSRADADARANADADANADGDAVVSVMPLNEAAIDAALASGPAEDDGADRGAGPATPGELAAEELAADPVPDIMGDAGEPLATASDPTSATGPVHTSPFSLPLRLTNLLQPAIPRSPRIMGILNVTPDSFSDGGVFNDQLSPKRRTKRALRVARELVAQGADIIDVGGESTRPGAVRVPQEEEAARVLPVVRELASLGVLVSVDTMYAKTAEAALDLGAEYVNDVSGGMSDADMLPLLAERGNPFILSHWRGHSIRMNALADYENPAAEVLAELEAARDRAIDAGLDPAQIVLDPGLGFAKRRDDNWAVLRDLEAFVGLGHPLLIGASRKRFTGEVLSPSASMADRDLPTAVITALAAKAGVWGLRVHNVEATRVALSVVAAWNEGAQDD